MTAGGMWLTASLCMSKVVVLLVRASTSSADGVDTRGKCLTSTDDPKKLEMMWMALMKMEADVSCGTLLLSHPKTKASLSVRRVTSLPMSRAGQHKKGRMRPTASRVEDLHPNA